MAKIERKNQKIFAGEATSDQITAFGTSKNPNPTYTTDLDAIQSDIYAQGWSPSLIDDLAPFLQDSNGLWYTVTRQLAYLFQNGIPEWDANTEYDIGSLVRSGNDIYQSKIINNINNELSNTTYWYRFILQDYAKIDLSNVKDLIQISAVTSTYDNGETSYRINDDKWCVQKFKANVTSGATIPLPKAMRDNQYFVVGSPEASNVRCNCYSKSSTGFVCYTSATANINFFVCGYAS